ncbi:hypothetical protein BN2537_5265 [Streptomyces venezuelae]|nr:hypothetical protein BN2537_5265 [Streptomyces venezuelae]
MPPLLSRSDFARPCAASRWARHLSLVARQTLSIAPTLRNFGFSEIRGHSQRISSLRACMTAHLGAQ